MMNNEKHYMVHIQGGPEPETPSVATRTQNWIREQISKLVHSSSNASISLRGAARNLDILPLLNTDGNRWYGVRPNGDLLSFELHAPHCECTEEDQWKRATVLFKASKDCPQLKPLVASAPLASRPCSRCGGSGEIQLRGESVPCICGGLGWVPPMFDEMDKKETRTENKPYS